MRSRSAASSHSARSRPSSRMRPAVGAYRRVSSLISVVLPEPFSPTSARLLPGREVQRHVLERRLLGSGVGEAHVLETHAVLGVRAVQCVPGRARHVSLQVFVQRRQVQVVLIHAADRGQHRRYRRLPLAEERHVHGHLPERDQPAHRGDGDPGVGAVQRRRTDESEHEAPGVAPHRQLAVLAVQPPEDVAIALEQAWPEAEELDLLGVVLAREHGLEVDLHARLGRAPAEQPEGIAGELRFGHERRQAREQQHYYRPGREVRQQRRRS